jgi:hypothetical protein
LIKPGAHATPGARVLGVDEAHRAIEILHRGLSPQLGHRQLLGPLIAGQAAEGDEGGEDRDGETAGGGRADDPAAAAGVAGEIDRHERGEDGEDEEIEAVAVDDAGERLLQGGPCEGTVVSLLERLRELGVEGARLRVVTALAAAPGLQLLGEQMPELTLYCACIDPEVDARSGMFRVRLLMDNSDHAIRPGMKVRGMFAEVKPNL